ncbi:MAG TPA: fumarate hydratase [Clostridiales bacterium]|jgi:fumarate hydratase subunit alpha|nr:fumarate hydratase [Clostridiales bacterium]
MRRINTEEIITNIKEMCIEANYKLASDVENGIRDAYDKESSRIGKRVLGQLLDNLEIAQKDLIPICQDTGMTIVFITIGQEVHIEGGSLEEAINEGIRRGYQEGYLRKSVVSDPLIRENTKNNTPGIIHYNIVPGDKLKITIAPKGFGSENMSRIYMLKPSDEEEGIKKAVIETVRLAGSNACPPIVVGVGIGGSFEKCAVLAKYALTRDINIRSDKPHIRRLEEELLTAINNMNIGPAGLGGRTTALGVNIETYPTHIAGLPVAVNISCHANRHVKREI